MFDFNKGYVPVAVEIDGSPFAVINYQGTFKPKTFLLGSVYLNSGIHWISIGPEKDEPLFLDLDYIEITSPSYRQPMNSVITLICLRAKLKCSQ